MPLAANKGKITFSATKEMLAEFDKQAAELELTRSEFFVKIFDEYEHSRTSLYMSARRRLAAFDYREKRLLEELERLAAAHSDAKK